MSAGGDAECIADLADAAILVVRQDQAPVRALNDCIDVLRRSDAEVLGCVFNNAYVASVSDRQSYGYGYGYDYGYGYGNDYGDTYGGYNDGKNSGSKSDSSDSSKKSSDKI